MSSAADRQPGQIACPPALAGRDRFSISDLSTIFGVTARTLRFYEDHGLLQPVRDGQNRIYGRQDYARLAWILRGKRVGFSLAEIKEMLDLYGLGDGRKTQRAVTIAKCRERIAHLEEQRDDIAAMIDELDQFCELLESMQPAKARTA